MWLSQNVSCFFIIIINFLVLTVEEEKNLGNVIEGSPKTEKKKKHREKNQKNPTHYMFFFSSPLSWFFKAYLEILKDFNGSLLHLSSQEWHGWRQKRKISVILQTKIQDTVS